MFHTLDIEMPCFLANSLSVNDLSALRMDSRISVGTASHRRLTLGLGSLNGVTGPTIFAIDSFVNPNF